MNTRSIFPSGLDLANLVINSNLLNHSLDAIYALKAELNPFQLPQQPLSLKWRIYHLSKSVIVAFATSSSAIHHLQQAADLVPSETLQRENFNLFDFLISKSTPSFSINRAAITLFHQHLGDLSNIKNQLVDSEGRLLLEKKSLVITGDSLGGSVAALFTLWLLDSINQPSKRMRPLCITFGSPLVGDLGLQKAVAECSSWNSCFLNVAAIGDPIPTLLLSQPSESIVYKPFGAFLLCSESGCTCVDDPLQVSLLLEAMSLRSRLSQIAEEHMLLYYGNIVDDLRTRLLYKGDPVPGFRLTDPLQSSIILQLVAVGDTRIQQPQQDAGIAALIRTFRASEERNSHNRSTISPSKKLHTIKIKMACLERYKMICAEKKIGYYDSHKNYFAHNHLSESEREIVMYKTFLSKYWIGKVEEAAKRPQKEGLHIRLMWLFASMHYRRMVEPLDIAEYYGKGQTNYEQARPKHYVLLEKWQNEGVEERPADGRSGVQKGNLAYKVTEDSCFWAKVEEATLACRLLKDGMSSAEARHSSVAHLKGFERYVMEQINAYAVSPDVFLEDSSFMKWWNGYKSFASVEIRDVMMNHRYVQYWKGGFRA